MRGWTNGKSRIVQIDRIAQRALKRCWCWPFLMCLNSASMMPKMECLDLKRKGSTKTYFCLQGQLHPHLVEWWPFGSMHKASIKMMKQRIIASATGWNTGWPHCDFCTATCTAMNTYTILRFPRIWTARKQPVFAWYHHHTPWRTLPLPKCIVISDVCADLSSHRCRIFRVRVDRFRTWSSVSHVRQGGRGILSKMILVSWTWTGKKCNIYEVMCYRMLERVLFSTWSPWRHGDINNRIYQYNAFEEPCDPFFNENSTFEP